MQLRASHGLIKSGLGGRCCQLEITDCKGSEGCVYNPSLVFCAIGTNFVQLRGITYPLPNLFSSSDQKTAEQIVKFLICASRTRAALYRWFSRCRSKKVAPFSLKDVVISLLELWPRICAKPKPTDQLFLLAVPCCPTRNTYRPYQFHLGIFLVKEPIST